MQLLNHIAVIVISISTYFLYSTIIQFLLKKSLFLLPSLLPPSLQHLLLVLPPVVSCPLLLLLHVMTNYGDMYCFSDIVTTVMPSIVPNPLLPISKYMYTMYIL